MPKTSHRLLLLLLLAACGGAGDRDGTASRVDSS